MSGHNINAEKCAAYLRSVGVDVSPEVAAQWIETERETRARNRPHNRELKKSCGHFKTYICRVISTEGGDEAVTVCSECRKYLSRKPWVNPPPSGGGKPLPVERIA